MAGIDALVWVCGVILNVYFSLWVLLLLMLEIIVLRSFVDALADMIPNGMR